VLLHFVDDNTRSFYFLTPDQFSEKWVEALDDPDNNYHVRANLRSTFDWIQVAQAFGENPQEKIGELHTECKRDIDSRALAAAVAAVEWNETTGREAYNSARAAIQLLDQEYNRCIKRDWNYVATFCLGKIMELQGAICHIGSYELERAIELIELVTNVDTVDDVPLGNFGDLVRVFTENSAAASQEIPLTTKALAICVREMNRLRQSGSLFQERDLLRDTIDLARIINAETTGLERRYVDTFWQNANYQAERGASLEASEIAAGLDDDIVSQVLTAKEKSEWKGRLRSAVQSATWDLRRKSARLTTSRDQLLHQISVSDVVDKFNQIRIAYDTQAALFWLLTYDGLVPEYDRDQNNIGISSMISQTTYSSSGHLIEFDPQDSDISAQYVIDSSLRIEMFVNILGTLFGQGALTEVDIYVFLNEVIDSANDQWYLTKVISNVFDSNHTEAIHLGVTRIEALLYTLLLREGEDVDALMDDGTGTRTLGSLCESLEDHVSEDFHQYLTHVYNEPVGQLFLGNLRNRASHGLLLPKENNGFYSGLIVGDLLRILARFNVSELTAKHGIPATLSIGTDELNLSTLSRLFPYAIKPSRRVVVPSEDEILLHIDSDEPRIGEVGEQFDIPFSLALAEIRVLESLSKIEIDGDDGRISISR
jgi:hypothetical protein